MPTCGVWHCMDMRTMGENKKKNIESFETRCYRRILEIQLTDKIRNSEVKTEMGNAENDNDNKESETSGNGITYARRNDKRNKFGTKAKTGVMRHK